MKHDAIHRFTACLIAAGAVLLCNQAASAADDQQSVSLTIDTKDHGAVISPLLFGHDLEVTRRAIWRGIGAKMVANRKFAAASAGFPKQWYPLPAAGAAVWAGAMPSSIVGRMGFCRWMSARHSR